MQHIEPIVQAVVTRLPFLSAWLQPPAPDVVPPEDPPKISELFDVIWNKLEGWLQKGLETLPNALVAVVVILVFGLLAKLVRKTVSGLLTRTPMPIPVRNLVTTAAGVVTVGAGLLIALGVLGLEKTVTSLLAGVGIIGLALGFAFQDIAANFMAGLLMSFRRPIQIGEIVETGGYFGTVEDINLRATLIRQPTGELVFLPNRQVFENPILNYSRLGQRRIDLSVGVSYGDDLELAKRVAVEAVEAVPTRRADRPVQFFYEEFGASSINFVVRFWVEFQRQPDYLGARSEAIERIHKAFGEHGITIPFPIRTLDFGIVGGERLRDHLRDHLAGAGGSEGDSGSG